MSGLLKRAATRVAPALRATMITQRANINSQPAQEKIGFTETAIGLGMLSLGILGPSGWILVHLEDYKKRE